MTIITIIIAFSVLLMWLLAVQLLTLKTRPR